MKLIITGGSKGLGKALARELVSRGDHVLITSRNYKSAKKASKEIKREAKLLASYKRGGKIYGVQCDVSDERSVISLSKSAQLLFPSIDGWICNAAQSGSYGSFLDDSQNYKDVITTNLLGSMICTKHALQLFEKQKFGSLFYMDGAGSDGSATPNYSVYGATKAGLRQLWESVKYEVKDTNTNIHMLSPGMVLTNLLLDGTDTEEFAKAFNILCEHPEVPAKFLTDRVKDLIQHNNSHTYVRYLHAYQAFLRFATYPWKQNRHFDEATGLKLYSDHFEHRIN